MAERVLRLDEALGEVLVYAAGLGAPSAVESVALLDAVGRVLAEVVCADRDQPPFDRSTRDGYAVRAGDVGGAMRLVGSVRAGESWRGEAMREGEAIELMTGAPLPEGADAVVMLEFVAAGDGVVQVQEGHGVVAGQNVVPRGSEARVGASLLPVGRMVGAAEVAVAASCGRGELRVFARPRVAVVATGDELVEVPPPGAKAPLSREPMRPEAEASGYLDALWYLEASPSPDASQSEKAAPACDPTHHDETVMNGPHGRIGEAEIWNSNSYALAALVQAEGGAAERLAIARDTVEDLRARIAVGREADLLVVSGGVSMGKYDLVEQVLREFGAEFFFTGALIQPGRPVVFGRVPKSGGGWTTLFGLPGNPVSTQVCFHLFVAPVVRALGGQGVAAPRFVEARLAEAVKGPAHKPSAVTRFLPAELVGGWDGVTVRVVGWQGSGDVAANARANCYAVLPLGVEGWAKGETVRVLLR